MTDSLRNLLSSLPLDTVGPSLRRAVRLALLSGDPLRLRRAGRLVAGELRRQGLLLRVESAGRLAPAGALHMLRGATEPLDLSPLEGAEPPASSGLAALGVAGGEASADPAACRRLLDAMEKAQALRVGDPSSHQREIILDGIIDLLRQALPGLRLFIELHDDGGPAQPGRHVDVLARGAPRPLWAAARSDGSSFWVPSAAELTARCRAALEPAPESGAFAGAAVVPLASPALDGEPQRREAGLLYVTPPGGWTSDAVLALARRLADFVAARWRQHLDVSLLVHTDSLTGVRNRAWFEAQFALELERAKRHDAPLTLILADIDDFKRVNDQHGHPAGDQVLRAVARELQGGLRRIDAVCRVGGEEFALLLPDTPPDAAREVAQRLLERLDSLRVEAGGLRPPLQVTLSFGAATYPEGGADAPQLYRRADDMLYLSKRGGRDRCTIWNPRGDPITLLAASRAS